MIKCSIALAILSVIAGIVAFTGDLSEATPIALMVMVGSAALAIGCAVGGIFEIVQPGPGDDDVMLLTNVHDV